MDLPAEGTHDRPGLHVHVDASPLRRAQQLADEVGGRLCTTTNEVDIVLDDLSALPPLDASSLVVLAALADRVATAERIVGRTVDRATEAVGERLAATGTGIAVHPSAVRERAATVVRAREAAAAAEERLRTGEAEAERAAAAEAAAPPIVAAGPVAVASTVDEPPAARWWQIGRRRRQQQKEDTSESTSLLQQVAATTDEAFGARRAAASRGDQLLLLRAQRDRAMEDVRVAERAWRDLAGDDPVEDVEAVVRRFDPQHEEAREVAHETVGVRAVSSLLERALAQWSEGWQSYGFDEPLVAPAEMAAIAARASRAVVLVGGAAERADEVVKAAPAAPVLLVEDQARPSAGG
ncbi:MAG: hypothetical protein ACJ739_16915 [Acidimicrobiales bacterium]